MAEHSPPEQSALWASAFASELPPTEGVVRDRFKAAWGTSRETASTLAVEISRDLPEFTQHDLTHMDALWRLGSQICGKDYSLNPAEGFVLGIAFLIHDLAMSNAAYKLTGTNIRDDATWPDALGAALRTQLNKAPTSSDLESPPEAIAAAVEKTLLRELHAQQAATLAVAQWSAHDGDVRHFIQDDDLRNTFGRVIGLIASSHHWPDSDLEEKLGGIIGAPAFAPNSWTVDPVALACILRTADAAHLDASRTPPVLVATRDLNDVSSAHWAFQAKLAQPYADGDRLVYSSASAFGVDEIDAWWLASDALKVVDEELRAADALLEARGAPRFAIRGVARTEVSQLKKLLACDGWEPVEAGVHVSDVAGVIRRLGGEELYGHQPAVALRELVANAADAVRAAGALAEYRKADGYAGRVNVTVTHRDGHAWLKVIDNGIGMSKRVLTTSLLDFGRSSWFSHAVVEDNPGLAASQFESTGRFGIGFFSVFMLGSSVQVTSRAIHASRDDTWILEFGAGLSGRANIRRASPQEQLYTPGTTVAVKLDAKYLKGGKVTIPLDISLPRFETTTAVQNIAGLVSYLFPISDIDIWASGAGEKSVRAVSADDWKSIPGQELLRRLLGGQVLDEVDLILDIDAIADHYGPQLESISDDLGHIVARVALSTDYGIDDLDWGGSQLSMVTAGICSTQSGVSGLVGVLRGMPDRATRDSAVPEFGLALLRPWVQRQVNALARSDRNLGSGWIREMIGVVSEFGADGGELRGWKAGNDWLTRSELVDWLSARTQARAVSQYSESIRFGAVRRDVELADDIVVFDNGRRHLMGTEGGGSEWGWSRGSRDGFYAAGATHEFYRAVSEAWDVPLEMLLGPGSWDYEGTSVVIGTFLDDDVLGGCSIFDRAVLEESARAYVTRDR